MSSRKFSAWELNHLRKFGFSTEDLSLYGEKPVEYITGHAEFSGLDFFVTPAVLIPRIESEKIIGLAYTFLKTLKNSPLNIADIGCGSGCLGISLAKNLISHSITGFNLYFSDISNEALSIAKGNCLRLLPGHQDKFHFILSDLMTDYPREISFNLAIANLPYIPSARISSLDRSVKDFEPITALDGGPDGTLYINILLTELPDRTSNGSLSIFEIDSGHRLTDFAIPAGFEAKIDHDIYKRPRFLIIRRKL